MAAANRRHRLQNRVVGRAVARQQLARRDRGPRRRWPAGCARLKRIRPSGAALRRRRARRTSFEAWLRDCSETPETFGRRSICFSTSPASVVGRHAQLFEQRRHYAVALRDQRPEQMQRLDLLLARSAPPSPAQPAAPPGPSPLICRIAACRNSLTFSDNSAGILIAESGAIFYN